MKENSDLESKHNLGKKLIEPQNITIIDVSKELKKWQNILINNIFKIFIFSFIGSILGFLIAYVDTPTYAANTRFMLKNEGVGSLFGGQMTGLTSLLGGGQMGTPLERTAEVISSDRIIGNSLMQIIKLKGEEDLVINHYIKISNLRDVWRKDSLLKNVNFSAKEKIIKDLSITQRRAYKYVKSLLMPDKGLGIVRKSFDKKSGVLTISCIHSDEDFSIALSNVIYNELSNFFIEQMTFSAINNAEVMREKLDSIQNELNIVRNSFARQTDQSLGLLLQQDKVELKTLAVKEQMLNIMYTEALRNYEGFRFINQAAMPSLTLIETPYSPIQPQSKSKFKYTILFCFLFLIIILSYLRFNFKHI